MSVLLTMVVVVTPAITLMEVTTAPVLLGTTLVEGRHVMVNILLLEGTFFLSLHNVSLIIIDINECNSNNGGCEQNCINQQGTYHCTCNAGYDLSSNKHNCDG